MDPLHDPRCLVTTEALFLDGANGMCGTPRQQAGSAPPLAEAALFAAVLVAFAIAGARRGLSRRSAVVAAGLLALAALPGLGSLAFERADRPAAVEATASEVVRAHDQVHAFAMANGGATLRTQTEMSVVPIARLALVGAGAGSARVDLFDDTLEDGCRDRGAVLTCGTPARHTAASVP